MFVPFSSGLYPVFSLLEWIYFHLSLNYCFSRWLSGSDLKTVALFGCPSLSRKNIFSAKTLRTFFKIQEDTVGQSSHQNVSVVCKHRFRVCLIKKDVGRWLKTLLEVGKEMWFSKMLSISFLIFHGFFLFYSMENPKTEVDQVVVKGTPNMYPHRHMYYNLNLMLCITHLHACGGEDRY